MSDKVSEILYWGSTIGYEICHSESFKKCNIRGSIHFTPVHFLPTKICTYLTFYPQLHSFYPHFPKIPMSPLTSHSQSLVVHVYLISHVSPHILHLDVWGILLLLDKTIVWYSAAVPLIFLHCSADNPHLLIHYTASALLWIHHG